MLPLPKPSFDAPETAVADSDTALLNHIRLMALDCRAKAQSDLFKACSLLSTNRQAVQDAYVEALIRGLTQALGKRPIFYRPGVAERSFDEAWLMQLTHAMANGDGDSTMFLLRSRVAKQHIRQLSFLVGSIARQAKAA